MGRVSFRERGYVSRLRLIRPRAVGVFVYDMIRLVHLMMFFVTGVGENQASGDGLKWGGPGRVSYA